MDPKAYWIWLQYGIGVGSAKIRQILEHFSGPKELYEAGEREWKLMGCFTSREMQNLSSYSLERAQASLAYCRTIGQQVITPDDEDFPYLLREIYAIPCVLYVEGRLPDLEGFPSVAVVGTRDATESGKQLAFEISYGLAKAGVTVVSGGALGIDAAAHKGALEAWGKTICVLGCGIGYDYLRENASLRKTIAKSGALVSEFPVNTPPSKITFPIRNRLISGLCQGTLVVEAASRSGSLITARIAMEQDRDVFAVPNSPNNPVSQGANRLIQSGAKLVMCAEDILEEYRGKFPALGPAERTVSRVRAKRADREKTARELVSVRPSVPRGSVLCCSEDARLLLKHLKQEPKLIAVLEAETSLPPAQMLAALTELELAGCAVSYSGRRYGLPKN